MWLASVRRRMNAKLGDVPDGALAQVGDVTVDRLRFARALRARLPEEVVAGALTDLVLEAAAAHALAEAKVVVTDAEVDAEIATMRDRFAKDPRVVGTGLTFDEYLKQQQATSEAELRTDARFRTRVGLQHMLSAKISDAAVRKHWEDNRDAFGERALVRRIHVPAADDGGQFHMPTFAEAKETALRAKVAVLESAGRIPGREHAGAKPLPEAVTEVAKRVESDPQRKKDAGEPIVETHAMLSGYRALDEAVFKGELGALQGPIKEADGWYVVVVIERRPAPPFEDVQALVREELLRVELGRFQLAMRADPNVVLAK
jgi:hypothetical protein